MKAFWLAVGVLIFVFLSIIAIAHFGLWGYSMNREIKPLDLSILAVNLFIALFLTQYLADKASNLRAEKDILIADLRGVLEQLKTCRESLIACQDSGKINQTEKKHILSVLRRASNGISLVESAIGMSQCSQLQQECEKLTNAYIQYKTSATGGMFPAAYTRDQTSEQDRTYFKTVREIHSLLFKINRLS